MRINFIFITSLVIAVYTLSRRFAGPYEVMFKSFYVCNGTDNNAAKFSTKLRKINKTHSSYSTNLSLPYGWTDRRRVHVDVSVWGNGGWKDNFLNLRTKHGCTSGRIMAPNFGEQLFAAAGYNFSKCPIPPGIYYIKDWIFEVKFAMHIFPYGKYKVVVTTYENHTKLTCAVGELDIVPSNEI